MLFNELISKGGKVMYVLLGLAFVSIIFIADGFALICVRIFSKKKRNLKFSLQKRVLELISQVSPVLGFLGTVTGVMKAFKEMGSATDISLSVVSVGMYEALYTTAVGLIISLVCGVCSQVFTWSLRRMPVNNINHEAVN